MTGIVDWAASRARMVLSFIALSLLAGAFAYTQLPKEGAPDIEFPAIFVSLPFAGISAEDSEALLLKPMESELANLDGLKSMSATAAEGYANLLLEFDFGWNKTQVLADVRDAMNKAEAKFPAGAEQYTIGELNFSEFPIIVVNLTGAVPERTLLRVAKSLQDRLEELEPVLAAGLTGHREEMVEVVVDPLRFEAIDVTVGELVGMLTNNNQLIAAGEVETETGSFAIKIPSSFDEQQDIYRLPVKIDGDRIITVGDIADIRLTFEDRTGTARFNGVNSVALQVVKRKGYHTIATSELVRDEIEAARATWPPNLQKAITVGASNDQSSGVRSMVNQLESSVLTAIALVMIVVLATLGTRSALLIGFAIPTSFLLCFAFLSVMGIAISNIVMFGLILSVGMLVDGAIVVVEYADKRIQAGTGPMHAFVEAAKRMFWPVVSSTATTLCAFLPMLFWPGVSGEFMGTLPVTLIFVLSASLVVALIYLPVVGGMSGRLSRILERLSAALVRSLPWPVRVALVVLAFCLMFLAALQILNPALLPVPYAETLGSVAGAILFAGAATFSSVALNALKSERGRRKVDARRKRTPFGHLIAFIAGNPVMPVVSISLIICFVISVFVYFGANSKGVEFFVDTEAEQAIIYVRARGNLSLVEKDALVREAEAITLATPGVKNAFAFAGAGGLNSSSGGAQGPNDAIGQIQIELVPWEDRPAHAERHGIEIGDLNGNIILENLEAQLAQVPGIKFEILNLTRGPSSAKPLHLRLKWNDWERLIEATKIARGRFEATPGLIDIEDNLPLPGIDWQIEVDVERAEKYGANVATIGGMIQLVTRGVLLDTMRVDSSDEEIEIRARLPEDDRFLSTLDSLKVRTNQGLVPLSNLITRKPVAQLAQITRADQTRFFDVQANVESELVKLVDSEGVIVDVVEAADARSGALAERISEEGLDALPVTATERIETLTRWIEEERPFPDGVEWEWTGDAQDQAEAQAFLQTGFMAALGLMFIILLAQFNSFYNAILVLLAVVLSTTGVLIGMLVMQQPFSVIMTGTGIVALAGIVVNNNIVLIDTYQEYSRYMPRIEAIIRTAESRLRPVVLTTITTIAGLLPMMLGLSFDFFNGGYSLNAPAALWWKPLATAVVFGLGTAALLTLVFTPSMLALRVWFWTILANVLSALSALSRGSSSRSARDWALKRAARKMKGTDVVWDVDESPVRTVQPLHELRATE